MKRLAKLARPIAAAAVVIVLVIAGVAVIQRDRGSPGAADMRRDAGAGLILITVDTLRADALGSAGNAAAATPVMDRLAAAGVRFTTAYAHNVVTLPSHANILSGRLPPEHGVRDNSGFRFPAGLDTLATVLKARGYRTGAFVSAFPVDSRFGLDRGFDVYDDSFADAARPAFLIQERRGADTVARARKWIAADAARPFFCWIHLYEPHYPYAPEEPFGSPFAASPYAGDVAAADAALAPLLDPVLDSAGDRRTLVVLTSDHGESLGEHGEATHGIFAYEATLRVPLLMYGPNLWKPAVVTTPAFHVDLMPTILDALEVPSPGGLAGRSLLPMIAGGRRASEQPPGQQPAYFEALSGALGRGWAPLRGVLSGRTKYIDLPLPELYDLESDPGEVRNLASSRPERVQAMRELLERWSRADRPVAPAPEAAEVRDRLRSLGYAASRARPGQAFTEADDPKRLIHLDGMLQDVLDLYLRDDLRGALARCRELVERRPGMAVSLLHLAHLERETGNLPAGIYALRRVLALDPQDQETAALLAAYLTEAGQAREAVALLEPFARAPDPDTQVLISQGLALARAGRPDEGLSALARARERDPTNAGLLLHVGTVHLMANRPDGARAAFEQALALNPSLARARSSLGAIAADRGDKTAALAHWRAAVASDPAEYRTVLGVGVSLATRGRAEEARPYLEFFISSAPRPRYEREIARTREFLERNVR